MKKTTLIACLSAAISSDVIADKTSDFEAYLGASHYLWDNDRSFDDATGLDLGAELPLNETISLDAWLSQVDADIENTNLEAEGERYSLGAMYHLADSTEDLRPFLSLGAGHQEFDVNNAGSSEETVAYLGGGVKKYFDNNVILRADLMAMNSLDHEDTDLAARIAVGYAFGRSASQSVTAKAAMQAQEEQADVATANETTAVADNDPKAATDDAKAAAPAQAATPKDSDGDGIVDALDKCSDTDKRYHVDADGCPKMQTEEVSIDLHVNFPTNSAEVPQASLPEIKQVADFMQKFKKTTVTIEGHTDDRGRDAYNKSLSQKRADAVRLSLINDFGLEEARVEAIGYGEEAPLTDNNTADGRAKNRRVVAIVKANTEKPLVK